ncbi:MAG: hypothetical protein SFY81_00220 [Verrucomicrobiota bacterium]|nr:hypothetical protein [Verrucomicrobiota bacterium]
MKLLSKAFLVCVAVLIAAEVGARFGFTRSFEGRFEYGYHPTAGFRERNGMIELFRAGGRKFHQQQYPIVKPKELFRVMVVGDSVPRGPSLDSAYPAQLAAELKKRGFQAEGWNLCLPGYGARRKQIVADAAVKYQPDLLILHVGNSNEYEDEREWNRSRDFQGWHPRNWLMKSRIVRRLYEAKTEKLFWRWLPQEIRQKGAINDADAELQAGLNAVKIAEWEERVAESTRKVVQLCREKEIPILLLQQGYRKVASNGKASIETPNMEPWISRLKGSGVIVMSMQEILEKENLETIFSDSSHLQAEGHAFVARAIAERITEEGLLSKAFAKAQNRPD